METSPDLATVVSAVIHGSREETRINPAWIANEVMRRLDPERVAPPSVYGGCNMHVRQIARSQLRKTFESEDEEPRQHPLFPELQWRYPACHDREAEPEYVLLEAMTERDVDFNIDRLLKEIDAKQKHVDALMAFKLEAFGRKTA